MNCPGPCARSFAVCIQCGACKPGLSERVQEILELKFEPAYALAVMA